MSDGVNGINNSSYMRQNISSGLQNADKGDFEAKLKNALNEKDDKKLKEASKQLEAAFINEIFKEMRKTIHKAELTESAPGKEMFESMFDQEVADLTTKGNGYGLADIIYKQLSEKVKNEVK